MQALFVVRKLVCNVFRDEQYKQGIENDRHVHLILCIPDVCFVMTYFSSYDSS